MDAALTPAAALRAATRRSRASPGAASPGLLRRGRATTSPTEAAHVATSGGLPASSRPRRGRATSPTGAANGATAVGVTSSSSGLPGRGRATSSPTRAANVATAAGQPASPEAAPDAAALARARPTPTRRRPAPWSSAARAARGPISPASSDQEDTATATALGYVAPSSPDEDTARGKTKRPSFEMDTKNGYLVYETLFGQNEGSDDDDADSYEPVEVPFPSHDEDQERRHILECEFAENLHRIAFGGADEDSKGSSNGEADDIDPRKWPDHCTIMTAIRHQRISLLQKLRERRHRVKMAELRFRDPLGRTVLHRALLDGWPEAVEFILDQAGDKVADILFQRYRRQKDDLPPLHMAMNLAPFKDKLHIAEKCVRLVMGAIKKLDQDLTTKLLEAHSFECMTALHVSCDLGCANITKLLLDAGASSEARDLHRELPLHSAIASHDLATLECILQATPVTPEYSSEHPALKALKVHNYQAIHRLYEYGWFSNGAAIKKINKFAQRHGLFDEWTDLWDEIMTRNTVTPQKAKKTALITHAACFNHLAIPEDRDDPSLRTSLLEHTVENAHRLEVITGETGALRANEFKEKVIWKESPPLCGFYDIARIHEYAYIHDVVNTVSKLRNMDDIKRTDWFLFDRGDTKISRDSLFAARAAAGCVTEAVNVLMTGVQHDNDAQEGNTWREKVRNVFCALRPPGHHAGPRGACTLKDVTKDDFNGSQGFCLLNNVAIGASYAMREYHHTIKRVAIVDFDVHHGNGTEAIVRNTIEGGRYGTVIGENAGQHFGNSLHITSKDVNGVKPWYDAETDGDNIFFASIHGYGWGFYPGSGSACKQENPTIINVPLALGTESDEMRHKFHHKIILDLLKFKPDIIFISAGFDGHTNDLIGVLDFDTEDYGWITQELIKVANTVCEGRIISVLEGGYNTRAGNLSPFAMCVKAHLRSLTNSSPNLAFDPENIEIPEIGWDKYYKRMWKLKKLKKKEEAEKKAGKVEKPDQSDAVSEAAVSIAPSEALSIVPSDAVSIAPSNERVDTFRDIEDRVSIHGLDAAPFLSDASVAGEGNDTDDEVEDEAEWQYAETERGFRYRKHLWTRGPRAQSQRAQQQASRRTQGRGERHPRGRHVTSTPSSPLSPGAQARSVPVAQRPTQRRSSAHSATGRRSQRRLSPDLLPLTSGRRSRGPREQSPLSPSHQPRSRRLPDVPLDESPRSLNEMASPPAGLPSQGLATRGARTPGRAKQSQHEISPQPASTARSHHARGRTSSHALSPTSPPRRAAESALGSGGGVPPVGRSRRDHDQPSGAQTPRTPGRGAQTPRTPGRGAQTPRTPGHGAQTPRTPGRGAQTSMGAACPAPDSPRASDDVPAPPASGHSGRRASARARASPSLADAGPPDSGAGSARPRSSPRARASPGQASTDGVPEGTGGPGAARVPKEKYGGPAGSTPSTREAPSTTTPSLFRSRGTRPDTPGSASQRSHDAAAAAVYRGPLQDFGLVTFAPVFPHRAPGQPSHDRPTQASKTSSPTPASAVQEPNPPSTPGRGISGPSSYDARPPPTPTSLSSLRDVLRQVEPQTYSSRQNDSGSSQGGPAPFTQPKLSPGWNDGWKDAIHVARVRPMDEREMQKIEHWQDPKRRREETAGSGQAGEAKIPSLTKNRLAERRAQEEQDKKIERDQEREERLRRRDDRLQQLRRQNQEVGARSPQREVEEAQVDSGREERQRRYNERRAKFLAGAPGDGTLTTPDRAGAVPVTSPETRDQTVHRYGESPLVLPGLRLLGQQIQFAGPAPLQGLEQAVTSEPSAQQSMEEFRPTLLASVASCSSMPQQQRNPYSMAHEIQDHKREKPTLMQTRPGRRPPTTPFSGSQSGVE